MHFKSVLPLRAQTNYIRNEIKRIHNRCSEEKDKITHTTHFINTLKNNDYSTLITQHLNNKKSRKLHTPCNSCFLKLPHFREIIIKEIRRAIHKEGLDIQLGHSGPLPRQYLMKKNNNLHSSQLLNKRSKHMPKNLHYLLFNLLKMPWFLYRKYNKTPPQ